MLQKEAPLNPLVELTARDTANFPLVTSKETARPHRVPSHRLIDKEYKKAYGERRDLLCYCVGGSDTMRTIILATILVFLAAPAMSQDCAAIQAACVDQCRGSGGTTGQQNPVTGALTGRVQACINRCSISSCQQTPLSARLCDATGQSICNKTFRSCTDACTPSSAATAAIIQSQASCATFCCTQFKVCLTQRQCDISTVTAITCEESAQ